MRLRVVCPLKPGLNRTIAANVREIGSIIQKQGERRETVYF